MEHPLCTQPTPCVQWYREEPSGGGPRRVLSLPSIAESLVMSPNFRTLNCILLVAAVVSTAHVAFRWNQLRFRLASNDPLSECSNDTISSQASYLALVCRGVLKSRGSLSSDPRELGRQLADSAPKLGFTWPSRFMFSPAGAVLDCSGEPFQITIASDRITVTSASLDCFYFAALPDP